MTTLATARETLDERVARLMYAHCRSWPPLHTTTTHAAIAELIARTEGLEAAIHAMALEIQALSAERDTPDLHPNDN